MVADTGNTANLLRGGVAYGGGYLADYPADYPDVEDPEEMGGRVGY